MRDFSTKRVLAYSWELFKPNGYFLVGMLLFICAFSFGTQFIGEILIKHASVFAGVAIMLVGAILVVMFEMGYLYMTIKLVRGEKVTRDDLMHPAPQFFNLLASSILYFIIVVFGLILFIVPGVIWAIKYSFYRYLVIDKCYEPMKALHVSGKITDGHKMKLFWFFLALTGINILGAFAFWIGLLITIPFTMLAVARVYDRLLHSAKMSFSE